VTKRRRPGLSRKVAEAKFWGVERSPGLANEPGAGQAAPAGQPAGGATDGPGPWEVGVTAVRPTPEPGALVRSLGPPPLAVDSAMAERHLVAVYEEAVRAATALAAANGLLATDSDEPG